MGNRVAKLCRVECPQHMLRHSDHSDHSAHSWAHQAPLDRSVLQQILLFVAGALWVLQRRNCAC